MAPIWSVLTEPVFVDYWTPRAGTVFAGLEKEVRRIGYQDMLVRGQVRMVRRRAGGGYFTILTPPPGTSATRARGLPQPARAPVAGVPGPEVPARSAEVPERLPRPGGAGRQCLRAPRAGVRGAPAAPGPGARPRRGHRRLPRPPAPDGGPHEQGRPDPDPAPVPHLRGRQAQQVDAVASSGGLRVRVPGVQRAEERVGRGAHGAAPEAGRRRPQAPLRADRRSAHPVPTAVAEADEAIARRAGTPPSRARSSPSRRPRRVRSSPRSSSATAARA